MTRMKAPLKPASAHSDCGTVKGYRRHSLYGEFPCTECLAANTANVAANKIVKGVQDRLTVEVVTIGRVLLHLEQHDPEYYEAMRAMIRPVVADACMTRAMNDL